MRLFANLLPGRGAVYGGAAILLGLTPQTYNPPIRAGEPRPPALADISARDWIVTNQARRLLQKDDLLSAHRLGVSVKGKVATIWGDIPSEAELKRAMEVLKKVEGIATVVSECRFVAAPDPIPQAVADAVKRALDQGDTLSSSARTTQAPSSAMTSRQIVAKPAPEAFPLQSPPNPGVPDRIPLRQPAVVLLTPVLAGPDAPDNVEDLMEKIRLSEKRFKDVVLTMNGTVLKMNGQVSKMKDAWELAEKLNDVKGISQVILGNIVEK